MGLRGIKTAENSVAENKHGVDVVYKPPPVTVSALRTSLGIDAKFP